MTPADSVPPDAGALSDAWPAPAKLNLFLHILGRRDDGYHRLQTVFQFLDFGDQLFFELRSDGRIGREDALPGVPETDDLSLRAAHLLQEASGTRQGVTIRLHKRLPLGGGLGGGSSDAATVLSALDRLWNTALGEARLAELALELGADVPVFVRGQAAWAEGVGEHLEPIALPEPWYLVVDPGVTVSTAEVFSAPELTRDTPPITIAAFLAGGGRNDCEPVVRERYPAVDQALTWLRERAPAHLTGTGGCVFAGFDNRDTAQALLKQLPSPWRGFIAQGRNISPLRERIQQAD